MQKIQFNKTAMIQIERDLKVRRAALPVLEAKEAALRVEIKKLTAAIEAKAREIAHLLRGIAPMTRLWAEMPDLVRVSRVLMTRRLVAGIRVPTITSISFDEQPYSAFGQPAWVPGGIVLLKEIITRRIDIHLQEQVLADMERVRRKTTQKVNLYQKVQIPAFEEAIRRIKRFLEDEENLSKSSQKILKSRFVAVALQA